MEHSKQLVVLPSVTEPPVLREVFVTIRNISTAFFHSVSALEVKNTIVDMLANKSSRLI